MDISSKLRNHLASTNIYVQREIMLSNILILQEALDPDNPMKYNYFFKQDYREKLAYYQKHLSYLVDKINKAEQMSFPFGS